MRGRKIRTPFKGRTRKNCKSAKKNCLYASGTQRRFCRKRRSVRRKWYKPFWHI